MEGTRGKKRKNRIRRTPNTGSSGRLSLLNNQDCSRQGTHIKCLLVISPWIMMQHDPMLITSSVKGSGLTALYGWSHCILATILQDRGGNWGSERLSPAQSHTSNKEQNWSLEPCLIDSRDHLKRPWGKDWRWEEKEMTENEMAGWHHQLDGQEFGWTPGVGDGQGSLACCNSWGHRVGNDWVTELNKKLILLFSH